MECTGVFICHDNIQRMLICSVGIIRYLSYIRFGHEFEMAFVVCEFHITSHLLFWASRGGATNSLSHVLHMGVSYSY